MAYPRSIFDLPTRKEDLISANYGMSDLYYDEIASLENIVDEEKSNNFGSQNITYRWRPTSWWIPSRSYFKMNIEISNQAGDTPLTLTDNIAPSMGLCSCLFSKQQYKINDKTISEISEHVAQVDAIKTRLRKSGEWMRTTGQNFNMWDSSFEVRQNVITSNGQLVDKLIVDNGNSWVAPADGNAIVKGILPGWVQVGVATITFIVLNNTITFGGCPDLRNHLSVGQYVYFNDGAQKARRITSVSELSITVEGAVTGLVAAPIVNQFRIEPVSIRSKTSSNNQRARFLTLIYQPPLSIFGITHALPPGCKHEFDFSTFSNTVYQKGAIESLFEDKTLVGHYTFRVKDMKFYAAMSEGPEVDRQDFFLDLEECRAQMVGISTKNRNQYSLDVSPSTHAFTIAFQSELAGQNTMYPLSKFRMTNNEELTLSNFYIRYDGKQKPQPDWRPLKSEFEYKDYFIEQYGRSVLYNGSYYDSSLETIEEWRSRGVYLHFPWPKTQSSYETRCYLSTQFDPRLPNNNERDLTGVPRLILFNHFKKVAILKYEDGELVDVLCNEV